MKCERCLIVAIGPGGLIGTKEGGLPWKSDEDFQFFRNTTAGWPVIFGENTYKNMPTTPLPNRLNIVVSTDAAPGIDPKGNLVFGSIESALDFAKNFSRVFIAGGRMVYKYALENNLVDRIFLSEIKGEFSGDVYFPIPDFQKWLSDNGWKMEYSTPSKSTAPEVLFMEWVNPPPPSVK